MNFKTFSDEFMTLHAEATNRPSEVRKKRSVLNAHLLPDFGHFELDVIGPREVALFIKAKLKENLSPSTINGSLGQLRTMLVKAQAWGYIKRVPDIKRLPVPQVEGRYLSREEAHRLLAHLSDPYHNLFVVALMTGARIGELLALSVRDVQGTTLTIAHSMSIGEIGPTKSGKVRHVPMGEIALIAAQMAAAGRKEGPLFVDGNGNRLTYKRAWLAFKAAAEKAGLPGVTPHTIRHSTASLLVQAGTPLATVAAILGHSTPQHTARYAHLSDTNLRDAVAVLGAALR